MRVNKKGTKIKDNIKVILSKSLCHNCLSAFGVDKATGTVHCKSCGRIYLVSECSYVQDR